jgi:hypothetical protein
LQEVEAVNSLFLETSLKHGQTREEQVGQDTYYMYVALLNLFLSKTLAEE